MNSVIEVTSIGVDVWPIEGGVYTNYPQDNRIWIMNKTLTLEIDEQLLDRAHRRAANENKSVPAWVAEILRQALDEAEDYEQNRRRALQHLD